MTRAEEWVWYQDGAPEVGALPPDSGRPYVWDRLGIEPCGWDHRPTGLWCTRPFGHTGRHAAGDGRHIVAVWS